MGSVVADGVKVIQCRYNSSNQVNSLLHYYFRQFPTCMILGYPRLDRNQCLRKWDSFYLQYIHAVCMYEVYRNCLWDFANCLVWGT